MSRPLLRQPALTVTQHRMGQAEVLAADDPALRVANSDWEAQRSRPCSHLSQLSNAFLLFLLVGWIIFTAFFPLVGGIVLVLLLPAVLLYFEWRSLAQHAELDFMVRLFAGGFVPGALCVLVIETGLSVMLALACFGKSSDWNLSPDRLDGKQSVPRGASFYIFVCLMAFVVAACTEEALKYFLILRVRRARPLFADWRGFMLFGVAGALGFSTIENVFYTFSAYESPSRGTTGSWSEVLATALERVLVSSPIHCLCALLTSMGVARRDGFGVKLPLWRVLGLPVFVHGGFDCALMLLAATSPGISDLSDVAWSMLIAAVALVLLWLFIRWEMPLLLAAAAEHERAAEAEAEAEASSSERDGDHSGGGGDAGESKADPEAPPQPQLAVLAADGASAASSAAPAAAAGVSASARAGPT